MIIKLHRWVDDSPVAINFESVHHFSRATATDGSDCTNICFPSAGDHSSSALIAIRESVDEILSALGDSQLRSKFRATAPVLDMELRLLHGAEVRAVEAGNKKQLAGYAAKYGVRSGLIGQKFREVIQRGAFDRVIGQDTVALVNHDTNMPLGRTGSGTLRLRSDAVGLKYELDLGNQSYAKDLYESVKRGDIEGCSFAFQLDKGIDDDWGQEDGMPLRYINNFRSLGDISFCTFPAYPETTIDARHLELVTAEARSREQWAKNWRSIPGWRIACENLGINPDTAGLPDMGVAIENRDRVITRRRTMTDFLLS